MVYKARPYGQAWFLALTSQTCYCPRCFKKQSHPPSILHIRLDLRPLTGVAVGWLCLRQRVNLAHSVLAALRLLSLNLFGTCNALSGLGACASQVGCVFAALFRSSSPTARIYGSLFLVEQGGLSRLETGGFVPLMARTLKAYSAPTFHPQTHFALARSFRFLSTPQNCFSQTTSWGLARPQAPAWSAPRPTTFKTSDLE